MTFYEDIASHLRWHRLFDDVHLHLDLSDAAPFSIRVGERHTFNWELCIGADTDEDGKVFLVASETFARGRQRRAGQPKQWKRAQLGFRAIEMIDRLTRRGDRDRRKLPIRRR